MGGEWMFHYDGSLQDLDMAAYHKALVRLKEKWSNLLLFGAQWFMEKPHDNIFAKFQYDCARHRHWGTDGHKPVWYLLWDPRLIDVPRNDIQARCAPVGFKRDSLRIQRELVDSLPNNFCVYLGDGISGYGDGGEEWYKSKLRSFSRSFVPKELKANSIIGSNAAGSQHRGITFSQ